jgi:nicotinamidase-related amidase
MTALTVDPKTSALLVMDFQIGVVDMISEDRDGLLARTGELLHAARAVGMRVIYVAVGFRAGYPEVSAKHPTFGQIKQSGRFGAGDASTAIHPTLAPTAEEVVVTKHRVSAFAGTDLDMILRANAIDTLVLAGLATSGVVLSTVRHAADADYRIVVVGDCCGDRDAEVHRVLLDKVFARQTTVTTARTVIDALARQSAS